MKAFAVLALLSILSILKGFSQTIDLDPIISAATAGATIKLQAATYTTAGRRNDGTANPGAQLPQRSKLVGAGQGRTLIVLVPTSSSTDHSTVYGLGGNLVSDLTIDCGATTNSESFSNFKRNGLWLADGGTSANRISRVTVLRQFGNQTMSRESFGITTEGKADTITECTVSEPRGTYCAGIYSAGGIVQNNRVIYPEMNGFATGCWLQCYGAAGAKNLRFIGNIGSGGNIGFYHDTGNLTNILIATNIFSQVAQAIEIRHQQYPNVATAAGAKTIKIQGNRFYMRTTNSEISVVNMINNWSNGSSSPTTIGFIDDIQITGNIFATLPGTPHADTTTNNRKAIHLATNSADSTAGVDGITGVTISGNTYQSTAGTTPWVHRNKNSAAKNVTVANETALTWITQ